MLGEGPTFRINESFGWPENTSGINFSKSNTKCSLSLHYNADNIYLFANAKEIFKFTDDKKNVNFPTNFVLEVYLTDIVLLSLEKYL